MIDDNLFEYFYYNKNTNKPTLSVWLLAYNHEFFIKNCLHGIFAQKTSFDFEILIGDDCSTDNTFKIIDEILCNQSISATFLKSRKNLWNRCNTELAFNLYKLCKGKYIALCEADDYWTDPYKLQKQVDYLVANPDCSICTHWVKTKDESDQGIHEDAFASMERKNPLFKDDLFINDIKSPHGTAYHPLSWVFRAELVNHIPKWIYPIRGGDDVLFTEFLQHGHCYCIPEFMGTYRITKRSSWAPLSPMVKTLAQIHFLINVRMHYVHYQSKVNKILDIHLNNLKSWKINRTEFTKLIKEILKVLRNDQNSIIPIINFYTKVFLHQFYYTCLGLIKIKIGKFRNMYF